MNEKIYNDPIGRKYATIDLSGREALNKGDIKAFEGFGENFKERFITALQFSTESQGEVNKRIIDQIDSIGKDLGFDFSFAGRDFPMHCTLEEGLSKGKEEHEREMTFEALSQDEGMKSLSEHIPDEPIIFKYILIDKGNIILTSVEIPESIIGMRKSLDGLYSSHDLKPLPMNNILHMSIGRITNFPSEESKDEKLKKYKQKMIELRHAISSNPLKLKCSNLFMGSTYNFLHSIE